MNEDTKALIQNRIRVECNAAPYFDDTFNIDLYLNISQVLSSSLEVAGQDADPTLYLARKVWHHWANLMTPEDVKARSRILKILFSLNRIIEKRQKEDEDGHED